MQLSSSAFSNGSGIPPRFTCDGDDLSPPLDWEAAPAAAGSFVLLCDDPDAPAGKWHHWAVYDIHADQTGLAEGAGQDSDDVRFKQAINDFDRMGYGGPCPLRATGVIVITFVCWPFRSSAYRSAPSPPAGRSNEKRAGMSSPKRLSWGSISDDRLAVGRSATCDTSWWLLMAPAGRTVQLTWPRS